MPTDKTAAKIDPDELGRVVKMAARDYLRERFGRTRMTHILDYEDEVATGIAARVLADLT